MLDLLQEHIEAIYGIRCEYRARDFLVDSPSALALGASGHAREELLVHQDEDGLELALYIDPALLCRVSSAEPLRAIELDMGGFCEVAEGVSHFVYLSRSAMLDRSVSLLELEAQAEVDKFAICGLLRWGEDRVRWAWTLLATLFDRTRLRETLSDAERWRYRQSSRIARAYCERLLPLFVAGDLGRVLTELRHGYRLGAEAKLHYFARR